MLITVKQAVEDQAFARTYRRGQDKETRLTRFIVDDSIDTQMVGMQKRKEAEIGQVVDNETRSRKKSVPAELSNTFRTDNSPGSRSNSY